jgi:hypothetical protein
MPRVPHFASILLQLQHPFNRSSSGLNSTEFWDGLDRWLPNLGLHCLDDCEVPLLTAISNSCCSDETSDRFPLSRNRPALILIQWKDLSGSTLQ